MEGEKRLEEIHSLKVGRFIIIEGEPGRIVNIKSSAPGKHGHAKFRIAAVGLFDNKKRVLLKPGDQRVEVPIINKKSAQVLSVSGDTATVMDMESYESFELNIPEELKEKIEENCQILYWHVMGRKLMKEVRK